MAFQVGVTKSSLTGPPPVPANIYTLRVTGFKPKLSAKQTSINYNAQLEIVEPAEFAGRKLKPYFLNSSFGSGLRDFVHATGNEMEKTTIKNEDTGEDDELQVMPGIFENADLHPQDPSQWGAYRGPLTNATFKAELVASEYLGRKGNDIRCFFCAVPGCAEKEPEMRHSQNLINS